MRYSGLENFCLNCRHSSRVSKTPDRLRFSELPKKIISRMSRYSFPSSYFMYAYLSLPRVIWGVAFGSQSLLALLFGSISRNFSLVLADLSREGHCGLVRSCYFEAMSENAQYIFWPCLETSMWVGLCPPRSLRIGGVNWRATAFGRFSKLEKSWWKIFCFILFAHFTSFDIDCAHICSHTLIGYFQTKVTHF